MKNLDFDDLTIIVKSDVYHCNTSANKDVKAFESNYKKVFEGLDSFLKEELITKLKEINVNKEEDTIANILFEKLQNVPLVDKYSAYQSLDDEWQTIAVDLEIINTEGIEACKKVEPNLVMKGKDEVQDGWKGKIMPFDMIQKTFLIHLASCLHWISKS